MSVLFTFDSIVEPIVRRAFLWQAYPATEDALARETKRLLDGGLSPLDVLEALEALEGDWSPMLSPDTLEDRIGALVAAYVPVAPCATCGRDRLAPRVVWPEDGRIVTDCGLCSLEWIGAVRSGEYALERDVAGR